MYPSTTGDEPEVSEPMLKIQY